MVKDLSKYGEGPQALHTTKGGQAKIRSKAKDAIQNLNLKMQNVYGTLQGHSPLPQVSIITRIKLKKMLTNNALDLFEDKAWRDVPILDSAATR